MMLTVYSKNNCVHCAKAKLQLSNMDIKFNEINVDEDPDAMEFIVSEGHRTMPQIYINGKVFVEGGAVGLQKLSEETIRNRIDTASFSGFKL